MFTYRYMVVAIEINQLYVQVCIEKVKRFEMYERVYNIGLAVSIILGPFQYVTFD